MTKNGVLKLKKHSRSLWSLSLSKGILLVIILLITACKSVPSGTIVKAHELLDKNKNFFISIPTSVDPELVKYLIKSNVQGISDSDVDELTSRINRAYAGLNADNKDSRLQLAVDSNIPVKYIGVGEGIDDLRPFDANDFVEAII